LILEKVQLETEKRRFFQPIWNSFSQVILPKMKQGIALCVSGGADSRALLEALACWPQRSEGRVLVFSVDHAIRSESKKEALAVLARAKVLGFESRLICLESTIRSDEASLRKHRYEALWRFAGVNSLRSLCTAHHQGDDAEGFLMDLFGLGGGHEGSAMSPQSQTNHGEVLRPFLNFSRKVLLQLLTVIDATDYFTDPSNENSNAKRSQIRSWLNADLLRFHPNPHQRIAYVAKRRGLDLQALYVFADQIIEIENPDLIRVRFSPGMPDGFFLRALAQALKMLLPNKDLRSANRALADLLSHAKKIMTDYCQGLDQTCSSFTLGHKKLARFDLPGVQATVTSAGIELKKNSVKDSFSVHGVVF
jgi:tRNA(Ile)-lysidine synthetase-like protein